MNVSSRELIDGQQAMFYGDSMKNDPSAVVGNVPVGFMTLRGYSVGYMGYLYDGLFGNPSIGDARYQLEGFERIEVLKGPSAFLNGLSNTSSSDGGYLNFVPKRPTDTPLRAVTIGYVGESIVNFKGV